MSFDIEKVWITKAGYKAVCIAIKDMHRCGYVGLPKEHPLHGIPYSEPTPLLQSVWDKVKDGPVGKRGIIDLFLIASRSEAERLYPALVFDVHGGITYSGGKDYPIENPDNLWWYGFDCGHNGDGCFDTNPYEGFHSGPVRSVQYVVDECEHLADQLKQCA